MAQPAAAFSQSRTIPVDAHVHFHARQLVAATLDSASANFGALGEGPAAGTCGALLLAQCAGETVFEWLRDQPRTGDWTVAAVPAEPQSLWLRRAPAEILVVCGRQVVAEPGLEVLALGTAGLIEDGLGIGRTVQLARSMGALAVLPWGFGKWTGRRRRRVRDTIASPAIAGLWMGDNGGRLSLLPRHRLLDEGERLGHGVLPGSDPFPFGGDYRRVGSFGCLVGVRPDPDRPWNSLRSALADSGGSPQAYGRGAGVVEFAWRQTVMQLRRRFPGAVA